MVDLSLYNLNLVVAYGILSAYLTHKASDSIG